MLYDPKTFLYFAYGSNLSVQRLRARTPSARFVTKARLLAHQLKWHKRSKDGSGKCDAWYTGESADVLWGALFEIAVDEKILLDRAEGVGDGYDEKTVEVLLARGSERAMTYVATHIDASLAPYHWYKEYVLRGARECGLPEEHVESIEKILAWDDPDGERVARA